MKILLVTFYEPSALGVRYLAASLLSHSHDVHILQMKNWVEVLNLQLDMQYSWAYAAKGGIYLGSSDVNPITDREKQLFASFVAEWEPKLVGFSVIGVFKALVPPMVSLVREAYPGAFIICGGGWTHT